MIEAQPRVEPRPAPSTPRVAPASNWMTAYIDDKFDFWDDIPLDD